MLGVVGGEADHAHDVARDVPGLDGGREDRREEPVRVADRLGRVHAASARRLPALPRDPLPDGVGRERVERHGPEPREPRARDHTSVLRDRCRGRIRLEQPQVPLELVAEQRGAELDVPPGRCRSIASAAYGPRRSMRPFISTAPCRVARVGVHARLPAWRYPTRYVVEPSLRARGTIDATSARPPEPFRRLRRRARGWRRRPARRGRAEGPPSRANARSWTRTVCSP